MKNSSEKENCPIHDEVLTKATKSELEGCL
jgi:hypothetical protein